MANITKQATQGFTWGVLLNADDNRLLERQLDYKVMMFLGDLLGLGSVSKQKDPNFTTEIQAYR